MKALKQSTSVVVSFGPFLDKTDGVTLETGLVSALDHATTGIMLSKNGGALAVRSATVTASTYDAHGCYRVTLSTTDTNTLGRMRMIYTDAATCLPVWDDYVVMAANIYDSFIGGGDVLDVSVTQLLGTAWLTPGVAGTPDVNAKQFGGAPVTATTSVTIPAASTLATTAGAVGSVTGAVGSVTGLTASDVGAIKTKTDFLPSATAGAAGGVFIAGSNAATSITTALTANVTGNITGNLSGTVGSVTGAVGSVTGAVGSVTGNVGGNVVGSVASVTAGVTVTTNNDKTGYGLSSAAVQAIWDALTSALTTVGSIGKKLADWVIGTTQTGDSFARLGAPAGASVSADIAAIKSDTAAILVDTGTTLDARIPAALVGGRMDTSVGAMANDVLTAAAIAADAIGASELAADAVTEIQSGLATAASIAALNNISAAQVNTEVDTALADIHLDHLLAADYDPAAKPGVATALLNEMVGNDAGVSQFTANALELAPTGGSAPTVVQIRQEMDSNSTQLAAIIADTAEIGTAGAGLTALGDTRIANLDAAVSTRSTYAGGAVASVTGAVGSVTGAVTVGTNNDKTGYALTAAYDPAKTAAQAGDAMALTAGERTTLTAVVWAYVVEGTHTAVKLMRLFAAALAGKLSGAATATNTIRDIDDTKNRIVATVDADGNRTAITLDES